MPENDSTGAKARQKGISKKGDRYLRSLLVSGAMAVIPQAQRRPEKWPWGARLLSRMTAKAAAIADKTAQIAWAIIARGGVYETGHREPEYQTAELAVSV